MKRLQTLRAGATSSADNERTARTDRRARRALWLITALAVALIITTVASAGGHSTTNRCSSPAGSAACLGTTTAPYVSPSQAKQVMAALWNAEERANVTRNAAIYRGVNTGSSLLLEEWNLDLLRYHGAKFYWQSGRRTIDKITVYLPRQTGYPLYFMAEVLATLPGMTVSPAYTTAELFVTKSSPAEPWRISTQVFDNGYGYSPAASPPVVDRQGYDLLPNTPVSVARTWPSLVAAYYTHLKAFGVPPPHSRLLPGPLTTGTPLANIRQGHVDSRGVVYHYSFVVEGTGAPWVISIGGGGPTSCADIFENLTMTIARPHTVFDQVANVPDWGPDLAPGYYSHVVRTFEWPICVTAVPNGLLVTGTTSLAYEIHDGGVPAALGPGTTRIA